MLVAFLGTIHQAEYDSYQNGLDDSNLYEISDHDLETETHKKHWDVISLRGL